MHSKDHTLERTALRNELLLLTRDRLVNWYAAKRVEAGLAPERAGTMMQITLEMLARYSEAAIADALAVLGNEGRWHTVLPSDLAAHCAGAEAAASKARAAVLPPLVSDADLTRAAKAKRNRKALDKVTEADPYSDPDADE